MFYTVLAPAKKFALPTATICVTVLGPLKIFASTSFTVVGPAGLVCNLPMHIHSIA